MSGPLGCNARVLVQNGKYRSHLQFISELEITRQSVELLFRFYLQVHRCTTQQGDREKYRTGDLENFQLPMFEHVHDQSYGAEYTANAERQQSNSENAGFI